MAEEYETFTLVWADRTIAVSHQTNWLGSGHWHIELRCDQRLPITTTGYRSIFVPQAAFADDAEIEAFVVALLDEAAQSKNWLAYLEDSKQLKFF
ncbi:hypothetical protein [Roseobacter sp. CCS2]|uniref:hypothetical protein n=1 Tax=Roseobacter sp. CCS2 TaxID=391593 RepID=UPI0000F3E5DA|nr:hypothetical protein [Roseobacter sp. CCS2]EBA12658.1 hypothetical protein RCCS2_15214 [Roseobacter sp. CCS2]